MGQTSNIFYVLPMYSNHTNEIITNKTSRIANVILLVLLYTIIYYVSSTKAA